MDKYVGKKLDGRYEIRELIGIGGMANVYRCYDTIDDREVAIKILKDEFLNNEEFIRRFKNESKAIAVLSHPNIVKVYDVSFGDMIQYIVMEYIDGITLKEYINQQNVLTWKETVHLVTQVLAALSHAHSKGVVHRDIKPQNMMLLSDGTIKVTDFGIARFSNSTRTMTEQAIGSVHYIAPEQAKGDITDGKTDIYSIGIMMYEMLTGKLPFDGENAVSVALMHLQVEPDTPRTINPSIPEGIEEIILKAMQKQPVDRYQSAQEMLADIDRFRMNPSVRFEYKYLYDKQPTKYIDAVNKGKTHRAKEYAKVVKDTDDEKVRHSLTIPIVTGILIAICISLIVCIIVGIFKSNKPSAETADVEVPNFINMYESDVQRKCDEMEYSFDIKYESVYYSDREIGVVIEQDPEPDTNIKIKETREIILYVNRRKEVKEVPNVTGYSARQAEEILKGADFHETPQLIEVFTEDEELVGKVIRTYPNAGSKISTSLPITFYIGATDNAKTEEMITFDYAEYVGITKDDAVEALIELGFVESNISFESISDTAKPKDEVVFTSLLSADVKKDDISSEKIILYISDGTPKIETKIIVDFDHRIPKDAMVSIKKDGDKIIDDIRFDNFVNEITIRDFVGVKQTVIEVCISGETYAVFEINYENDEIKDIYLGYDGPYEESEPTVSPDPEVLPTTTSSTEVVIQASEDGPVIYG